MNKVAVPLHTHDGMELTATLFEPVRAEKGGDVILLVGAIGIKQSFYPDYARFLAGEG